MAGTSEQVDVQELDFGVWIWPVFFFMISFFLIFIVIIVMLTRRRPCDDPPADNKRPGERASSVQSLFRPGARRSGSGISG